MCLCLLGVILVLVHCCFMLFLGMTWCHQFCMWYCMCFYGQCSEVLCCFLFLHCLLQMAMCLRFMEEDSLVLVRLLWCSVVWSCLDFVARYLGWLVCRMYFLCELCCTYVYVLWELCVQTWSVWFVMFLPFVLSLGCLYESGDFWYPVGFWSGFCVFISVNFSLCIRHFVYSIDRKFFFLIQLCLFPFAVPKIFFVPLFILQCDAGL